MRTPDCVEIVFFHEQGVKGSKAPMQLLSGLILHDAKSQFTPEAESILRDGMAWRLR